MSIQVVELNSLIFEFVLKENNYLNTNGDKKKLKKKDIVKLNKGEVKYTRGKDLHGKALSSHISPRRVAT